MAAQLPTINDLPDAYLLCRRGSTLGHAWETNPSARVDGDIARAATYVIPSRCDRCGKEKFVYLDSRGMRMGQYYRDPDGYSAQRATADDVLAEIFSRSLLIQAITVDGDKIKVARPTRRVRKAS